MSEVCGAPSIAPLPASYFPGSGATGNGVPGVMSTGGAHTCMLPGGHEGSHARRTYDVLGPHADGFNVAMRYTYLWNDEHALQCLCEVVSIEPRHPWEPIQECPWAPWLPPDDRPATTHGEQDRQHGS